MTPTEIISNQIQEIRKTYPAECKGQTLGCILKELENRNNQVAEYIVSKSEKNPISNVDNHKIISKENVSKSERLSFVKKKYDMSAKDVLMLAHYNKGYNVIMVGELSSEQWDEIVKEAEDFHKDGLLHSYLGHL